MSSGDLWILGLIVLVAGAGAMFFGKQLQVIHHLVNANTQKLMADVSTLTTQVVDLTHVNARIEMTLAEYKRQMGPLAAPELQRPPQGPDEEPT